MYLIRSSAVYVDTEENVDEHNLHAPHHQREYNQTDVGDTVNKDDDSDGQEYDCEYHKDDERRQLTKAGYVDTFLHVYMSVYMHGINTCTCTVRRSMCFYMYTHVHTYTCTCMLLLAPYPIVSIGEVGQV